MDPKLKAHLDRILADLLAEEVAIKDMEALQALLAKRSPGDSTEARAAAHSLTRR